MKKIIFTLGIVLASGAATLFLMLHHSPAARASFNANNLIDDYTFDNVGTLSAGQIDSFLNSFPNSCISPNSGFSAILPTGYSPNGGFTYGGYVSAGSVVAAAAQAYSINPEVLLVTLQKEQSLVAGGAGYCNNGDENKYTAAVGYGCPDGGTVYSYTGLSLYRRNGVVHDSTGSTCVNSSTKAGFSQQVIRGAWLLKFGEQRSEGNINWAVIKGSWNNSDDPPTCYGGPMTQGYRQRCQNGSSVYYDGFTTIDGTSTHMDNGATAALYWYTPHFHGNQNFVSIFESWFGATTGQGFSLVISDDPNDLRQWVVYGNIKQHVPDSQTINAWGLGSTTLVTMPAARLAAIPTGPDLARLFRVNGGPDFYFVDNAKKYRLYNLSLLDTWNIRGMTISSITEGLANLPADAGWLAPSVQRAAGGSIYMMDGRLAGGQTNFRPYNSTDVFKAIEGTNAYYNVISDDLYSSLNVSIGDTLTSARFSDAGNQFMADEGTKRQLVGAIQSLYPAATQAVSDATITRLDTGPDIKQIVRVSGIYYLIDGSTKHLLGTDALVNAWLTPGTYFIDVNQSFVNLIPTGTAITGYSADVSGQMYLVNYQKTTVPAALDTAYRTALPPMNVSSQLMSIYQDSGTVLTHFFQTAGTPSVYMLDNSGKKHLITDADTLTLWGGYVYGVPLLSGNIANLIGDAPGTLGVYVTDGTTEYVLADGKKETVSAAQKSTWNLSSPQLINDGTLNDFLTNGSLSNKFNLGSSVGYYIILNGASYGTVDPSIAEAWGILAAPTNNDIRLARVLTNQHYPLTRFVRSNGSSDYTMYLIDRGVWYTLPWAQYINLGGIRNTAMIVAPPSDATISTWLSPVVKSTNGTYYVIDGGGIRNFPAQMIVDQWTQWGSLPVNTVSDSFINTMHYWGIIERTIKGSRPAVFTVQNGQKRHILYPDTYNRLYAPYMFVSDPLLDALPDGPDV